MSMPTFHVPYPPIALEDAISMILTSIAMEELGFGHILTAESEKLQYVLDRLPKDCGKIDQTSIKNLLEVNNSIKCLLDSIVQNQIILKSKLDCAVGALNKKKPCPPGPPGPPGPARVKGKI